MRQVSIAAMMLMRISMIYFIVFGAFSASFADDECDNTTYRLIRQGKSLSATEAEEIENSLLKTPDNLEQRIVLIGYYNLKSFGSVRIRETF